MERYEFRVTTAKADIIIGLAFPMIIMFPILWLQLALFYLRPNSFLKAHPIFLYLLVLGLIGGGFVLIKRIQKSLVRRYTAELCGRSIRICIENRELISGTVSHCNMINKEPAAGPRAVSLDIYTDTGKIKFRARAKEYKKITVSFAVNPLGTSEESDIEALLSLGRKIEKVVVEQREE